MAVTSFGLNFGNNGNPQTGMFGGMNANTALSSPDLDQFLLPQDADPNNPLAGMVQPQQQQDWGFNIPTAQLGLQGLSALGGLYTAFKANGLAEDRFDFAKDVTNTNLRNQIASYNTSIRDRARSRGAVEGQNQQQVDQYVSANSLRR